jgi:hypothetical protein
MDYYEEITNANGMIYDGYYYLYESNTYHKINGCGTGLKLSYYRKSYPTIRFFIKKDKPKFENDKPFPHGY